MAFRKDKTTAAQTAANVAGAVTSAFISAGVVKTTTAAGKAVTELFEALFEQLAPVVEEDNEGFAAAEEASAEKPARKSSGSSPRSKSSGSASRAKKTSGGGRSKKVSLADALDLELTWGAFEGLALSDILELDVAQCEDDYEYGDGERDGRDYIAWLASDSNKNEFVRTRAQVIADEEGIDY